MDLDLGKVTNKRSYTQNLQTPLLLIPLELFPPENKFFINFYLFLFCHQ